MTLKIAMLAACSLLAAATAASAAVPAKTGHTPSGDVLQTPAGMTLYVYDADKPGVTTTSQCDRNCSEHFPPFLAAAGASGEGEWSLVPRADGARQWAYRRRPLYTFAKDKVAGETNGIQGNGNTWHAAAP